MSRTIRTILAALGKGWTLEARTGGGHLRFRHTTGALIHTGSTPNRKRLHHHVKSNARKAIRNV